MKKTGILLLAIALLLVGCQGKSKKNDSNSSVLKLFLYDEGKTVIQSMVDSLGEEFNNSQNRYTWSDYKLYDDYYGELMISIDNNDIVKEIRWDLDSYTKERAADLFELLKKDNPEYSEFKDDYVNELVFNFDGKAVNCRWRYIEGQDNFFVICSCNGKSYDDVVEMCKDVYK